MTTAHAQPAVEEHEWVLLIDASDSFKGGTPDVRNEALIQIQTMLAIATERNPARPRRDRLRAFRFGAGVQAIDLPGEALNWGNVRSGLLWNERMPPGFKNRSDFVAALRRARDEFETRPGTTQHVILITDGDLDVLPDNRPSRNPPGKEEEAEYRKLFDGRGELLSWFVDRGATIDTLYVSPATGLMRLSQEEIRRRLNLCRGEDAAAKALSLVLSITQRATCAPGAPGLGTSEGPYILRALAEITGGKSHTVDTTNLVEALRHLITPDLHSDKAIPPGTRILYAFGGLNETVKLRPVDSRGRRIEIELRPNRPPVVNPPDVRIEVDRKPGLASAIWRVVGDFGDGGYPADKTPLLAASDLGLDWITPAAREPIRAYVGSEFPVQLSLVRQVNSRRTVAEWREYFRSRTPLTTSIKADVPGTNERLDLRLVGRIAQGETSSIVDFVGKFRGFPRPGKFVLRTELSGEQTTGQWVQTPDRDVTVDAVTVPNLRVIPVDRANPAAEGFAVRLTLDPAAADPVAFDFRFGARYRFEVWHDADGPSSVHPSFRVTLKIKDRDYLVTSGRPVLEDLLNGRKIVWRTGDIPIQTAVGDVPIVIEGGAGPLHGRLRMLPPPMKPVITSQSTLMNPDERNACPSDSNAELFSLQQHQPLVFAQEGDATPTTVAAPRGRGPI
jgi:hypothetical protein